MTVSPNLPTGCTLRPAQPTDRVTLRQFVTQLQTELLPAASRFQFVIVSVILSLMVLALLFISPQLLLQVATSLIVLGLCSWLTTVFVQSQSGWKHFWVIESGDSLIACAKLCQYHNYAILYDVYVVPTWRRQGLGSYLVQALSQQATKPLYLACFTKTVPFYARLGFISISPRKLPPIVQHDLGMLNQAGVVPLVLL